MCDKAILENSGTLESVPDRYKTQEMCNKAFDNYAHALKFVYDCYKIQKMCNKVVNTYPSTTRFALEYSKTRKMCDKAVNACCLFFVFHSVTDQYKTQEMFDKLVFKDPFMLMYYP